MNSLDLNGRLRMHDYDVRVRRLMTERDAIRAAEAAQSERLLAQAQAAEKHSDCSEPTGAHRGVAARRPA